MTRLAYQAWEWIYNKSEEHSLNLSTIVVIGASQKLNADSKDTYYLQNDLALAKNINISRDKINSLPIDKADTVLVFGSRSRAENYFRYSLGMNYLKKTGKQLFILENQFGGHSVVKHLAKKTTNSTTLSKHHNQILISEFKDNESLSLEPEINEEGYYSYPSLFSSKKIDPGSKLLLNVAKNIGLKGHGVDLGCGYGYLGISLLDDNSSIDKVTFLDSDLLAIAATRKNLHFRKLENRAELIWQDILQTNNSHKKYDWIISNIPFHQDEITDRNLSRQFVESICKSLTKDGLALILWHSQAPNLNDSCWQKFKEVKIVEASHPYWVVLGRI